MPWIPLKPWAVWRLVSQLATGHIFGLVCEGISRKDRPSSEKVIPGGQPLFGQVRGKQCCLPPCFLLPPPWNPALGLLGLWSQSGLLRHLVLDQAASQPLQHVDGH